MSAAKIFISLAFMVGVSGCVTLDRKQVGPYPAQYKEIVKQYVDKTYYDPYSMRGVAISRPQKGHLFFQQGWIVCFRTNAKNRMGGYTGLSEVAILINRHEVVNSMDDAPLCEGVAFEPWPEMENR